MNSFIPQSDSKLNSIPMEKENRNAGSENDTSKIVDNRELQSAKVKQRSEVINSSINVRQLKTRKELINNSSVSTNGLPFQMMRALRNVAAVNQTAWDTLWETIGMYFDRTVKDWFDCAAKLGLVPPSPREFGHGSKKSTQGSRRANLRLTKLMKDIRVEASRHHQTEPEIKLTQLKLSGDNRKIYLKRSPEAKNVIQKVTDIATGNPYHFSIDESDLDQGTDTSNATRAAVNKWNKKPTKIDWEYAVYDKRDPSTAIEWDSGTTPNPDPQKINQPWDAGHSLGRQNGGLGNDVDWVFPQNPQYNRGNRFNGKKTYKKWRDPEDVFHGLVEDYGLGEWKLEVDGKK